MQILPVLLFLSLFFCSCNEFQPDVLVRLTFQQLDENEKGRLIVDSIFREQDARDAGFMSLKIQNWGYDSLFIPAYRLGKDLFCATNGYNAYRIENDSLTLFESSFPTHCRLDTAVCLLRNQWADLIFAGRCADSQIVHEYDFIFMADSAGQKIFPEFLQFPCGNVLPKK